MATSYKTPGVYVEEISKFPPSVAEVETAIPIFIGYTETAGLPGAPIPTVSIDPGGGAVSVHEAVRIESLLEYTTYFGKGPIENLTITVSETFNMAAVAATPDYSKLLNRTISVSVPSPNKHTMYYHMQMYFANGGGPCYIVSVGGTGTNTISKNDLEAGLMMAQQYDEPTLTVFPEAVNLASADDAYTIYGLALLQAATLQDRFVVMDCYAATAGNVNTADVATFRNSAHITDNLKYGAVYYPYLRTSVSYHYDVTNAASLTLTVNRDETNSGTSTPVSSPTFAATLSGEAQTQVKSAIDELGVVLPPCAAMVGVYANVDSTRGVWKAPANVGLQLVNGLTQNVSEVDQAGLNVDPVGGKSVNVIRAFTGKGVLVWGARTLAGNDNDWRYISVRRFCIMVEMSSKLAAGTFVFEPNDANTWAKVQGMLENFLTLQWRAGALQGAKSSDAFYVSVGLNKTMTAQDILEGRMIVEIGMAVVRPAEFIILRFSQMMATS